MPTPSPLCVPALDQFPSVKENVGSYVPFLVFEKPPLFISSGHVDCVVILLSPAPRLLAPPTCDAGRSSWCLACPRLEVRALSPRRGQIVKSDS